MKCLLLLFMCWCSSLLPVTSCIRVQLSPPVGVEVQPTPENFNVTWKSGYEDHQRDIDKDIIYQLVLQATLLETSIGEDTHLNVSSGKVLTISRSRLKPASSEQENILVILTKSLVSVCVVVGVLLFVFYSPAARMKIKNLSHTPSPATFFQPLFQQHEGNLKEWLSPQGKYMLTYTAEEILTSDAIIVVPKPIAKDPEENQGLQKPPVTQLTFTQCQTSYVGLPGIHEASPPLTTVSPGNTSYTRLPCSARGFEIGEIEVVSPSPEDIFNISHSDSGCEDLTQSPECSSPNSPVDNTPPPCYCNDYCILNKTADGFAPVLVSKEAV
ncbi:hypothetical protein L3Q82_002466 [Scortum barcoo]|uniref:Uncharacterized protein n=1 Tax=Scortum barcoo TaxID=214431 RepID=A0ACB8VZF7_9TELE|nr:hypothetical protein L3Q82_002466 [Scortum barcoo]